MKSTINSFIILFISSGLVLSCSSKQENTPLDFNKKFLNSQITLSAPKIYNTFHTGDDIGLEIISHINSKVVFPNNYNVKIFSLANNVWVEIFEIPTVRLPEGDFEIVPSGGARSGTIFSVSPNLPDYNKRYQLRIYIFGKATMDNKDITLGAFTDVILQP